MEDLTTEQQHILAKVGYKVILLSTNSQYSVVGSQAGDLNLYCFPHLVLLFFDLSFSVSSLSVIFLCSPTSHKQTPLGPGIAVCLREVSTYESMF